MTLKDFFSKLNNLIEFKIHVNLFIATKLLTEIEF